MSFNNPNNKTLNHIKETLKHINDVAHDAIINHSDDIFLAKHDKRDPTQFEIIADSIHNKKLEGIKVKFSNPQDFKRIFPNLAHKPYLYTPPNTHLNMTTGQPEGNHKDPYQPIRAMSVPPVKDKSLYDPTNVFDGNPDTIWAIDQLQATHATDLGQVVEVGAIHIAWHKGDKRQYRFAVGISNNEENSQYFDRIPNLNNVYSTGKTSGYETYNLEKPSVDKDGKPYPDGPLMARYIVVQVEGNTSDDESDMAAITGIMITKAKALESMEVKDVIVGGDTGTDIDKEPKMPESGRIKEGGWGGDMKNPEQWTSVVMNDDPNLWKVIDGKEINIADRFTSEIDADLFIKFYQYQKEMDTEPIETETEPVDPIPTKPVEIGDLVQVAVQYPEPKTKDPKVKGMEFNENVAKQNYAKNPGIELPLLAHKKDKYGEYYTNIPELCRLLGLKLTNIKNYNYQKEIYQPKENNNSGGESKRYDMEGAYYPQFEYRIKLKNESKDKGDETSCKHFGPHNNDDDKRPRADTFIVQITNDGEECVTQLEPSHMDSEKKYSYGDKFNKVKVNIPAPMGKTYIVSVIRLANIETHEVICIIAIKFLTVFNGTDAKWNNWNVIYETHVFGGQGGNRALKDPFQPWVISALGLDESESQVTIRCDAQPKEKIKRGTHYDLARITEIVDFKPKPQ